MVELFGERIFPFPLWMLFHPAFQTLHRLCYSEGLCWVFSRKNYSFYPFSFFFFFSLTRKNFFSLLLYSFEIMDVTFETGENYLIHWKVEKFNYIPVGREYESLVSISLKIYIYIFFLNCCINDSTTTFLSNFSETRKKFCGMEGKLWTSVCYTPRVLSKFHPRSGDCIWIQRATHRRNTALFVTRQNLRRCVLPLPVPAKEKSQRSLQACRNDRDSHVQ